MSEIMHEGNDKGRKAKFRPLALFNVGVAATALVAVLASHPLPEASAEAPPVVEDGGEATTGEATTNDPTASKAATSEAPAGEASAAPDPVPAAIDERRALRVTGLGWELLAPGLLANGGHEPKLDGDFGRRGLDLSFTVSHDAEELAAKLARGGAVAEGADVAVLPLPTFVASYEQLRALSPEIFFVLGWSAGRDAIAGDPGLLTDGRLARSSTKVELVGARGQAATMLALMALEQVGVDTRGVVLVDAGSEAAAGAQLQALERSPTRTIDARELLLTSADAPRLIPIVAVAPAALVRNEPEVLAAFTATWLAALDDLAADVPGSARAIAALPDAPEAVALLEMLGALRFCELGEAARMAGLSGRDAISLELLFRRSWELWRDVGVISTPAPEHAPLANDILARVALGEGAPLVLGSEPSKRGGHRLALVHSLPKGATIDEQAVVDELGFLAGSFARADIELRVRGDAAASRRIVAAAIERYELDPEHLRVADPARGREALILRVLVP